MRVRFPAGIDRLLDRADELHGRRFGMLAHQASLTRDYRLAHVALWDAGYSLQRLFGPEHGFYGVEQDMIAALDATDPLTEFPIRSLYGDEEGSLRPSPGAFEGLDLLIIDLQDIGSRYYTFAATAVWAAEVALSVGCEVWLLDRPNPLGFEIEGNLPEAGFESFVGAFRTPVRHGLTMGELLLLEASRRGLDSDSIRVFSVSEQEALSPAWWSGERPWVAPSPNMPSLHAAAVYPGLCLIEATQVSEGRGTTRPFQLVGAPGIDPGAFARRLEREIDARYRVGIEVVPSLFRPQFQKHAGALCGGVELLVTSTVKHAFRFGLELLGALWREGCGDGVEDAGDFVFGWRREAYEFRTDHPAIDLLCGSTAPRDLLTADSGLGEWCESFARDEEEFRTECEERRIYLYPRAEQSAGREQ